MDMFSQLIRIMLYNGGALLLGKGVADGEMYQAAMGGVVSIVAFVWWWIQQKKIKINVPPNSGAIALIVVLPLLLGGCTTLAEGFSKAMSIISQVRSGLVEVRNGIRSGCNALGIAEQQAAASGAACGQKLSRLRAGVNAICVNQSLLTDDVVGNYFSSVANAVKQAQAACK